MKVPVKALRDMSKANGLKRSILFAWDGNAHHVVTWGDTVDGCSQAADFGNKMKEALGWPESLHAQPLRVKKLEKRIQELEAQLKQYDVEDDY